MTTGMAEANAVRSDAQAIPAWLRRHERLVVACVAAALVVPCIWQRHIESVDLPSHVYNAWLAWLVAHGQISGLKLVHPMTNVLADWILSAGFAAFGPAWAARILCVVAVEGFFWGAFRFASVVSRKNAWVMAPCLAMLSYGFVFYLGFMNFYLATACAMWMLAILWRFSLRRLLAASLLGVVGILGSPLPVAWAVCAIGYAYIARRVAGRGRLALLAAAAGSLIAVHFVLTRVFVCEWSLDQVIGPNGALFLTGVSQFDPFGLKYRLIGLGLLLAWLRLVVERIDRASLALDPLAQVLLLNIFAMAVLPSAIRFPGYAKDLQFIEPRVSFFAVIVLCVWLGAARHGIGITRFSSALALLYFVFLYADARALNRADAEITSLVSQLPPRQRVVASVEDSNAQSDGLFNVLGWACIGRCFDYGNYEPSTRVFRVQVTGPNQVVAPLVDTVLDIKYARHTVTAEEAPLYSVCPSSVPGRRFELRKLEAGERTCSFSLPVTPTLGRLFW
jgi:hypothetical protein